MSAQLFTQGFVMPRFATAGLATKLRNGSRRALRSPWLHPLNDSEAIDDLLAMANPRWSLTQVRAEVVAREAQTADTASFWLRPNWLWTGFRAGQHVTLTVEIEGVRHQRVYSLSSDPAQPRLLRLTVKRQPEGRVSNWLHTRLRVGDVIAFTCRRRIRDAGGWPDPAAQRRQRHHADARGAA